jgi:restriction system protein
MRFLVSVFKSKSRSKETIDFLSALEANYQRTVSRLLKLKLETEVKHQKFDALFDHNFSRIMANIENRRRTLLDRIDTYITETDRFYKACKDAEDTQCPASIVLGRLGSLNISLTSHTNQDRQQITLLNTAFDNESRVLLVEFYVPSLKVALETYRVLTDKPTQKSLREVAQNYLPAMGLALARKALDYLETTSVDQVVINLKTEVVDLSTGHVSDHYVFSALFPSDRIKSLVFAKLDPSSACNKFQVRNETFGDVDQVITPLLIPEDDRIVEGRDVNSSLRQGQNLAALDWEDFEHLVRQLFERLFAGKGATVSVTRASKDKGVDAIVFDPTPVTGFGKIVIQAKRYVNTVDVSAVRDLYGTVINEGATKGILVTTSKFGPDAVSFAHGKPLEFIDGANLVRLMGSVEMGSYRVDLDEARRLLGLRPNR